METIAELWFERAFSEVRRPLTQLAPDEVDHLVTSLHAARRVAVYGVGREGLMMRGLGMRLYHLGLDAHVVGEMTTPPLDHADDWLVVSAGPGAFSTVAALAKTTRAAGARVALLTARPDAALRPMSDCCVVLPAPTMANGMKVESVLPMGSAYEGALFMFCEYVIARLMTIRSQLESEMRARHTNLE